MLVKGAIEVKSISFVNTVHMLRDRMLHGIDFCSSKAVKRTQPFMTNQPPDYLAYIGLNQMGGIKQTGYLGAVPSKKILMFELKCHWSLFLNPLLE